MQKPNHKIEFESDDEYFAFLDLAYDIEKEWKASLPRLTAKELLQIFPDVKDVIEPKLKELNEERQRAVGQIKILLLRNRKIQDNFQRDLDKYWIQTTWGKELLDIDRQMSRFKHYSSLAKGRTLTKGGVSDEAVDAALNVPIESITNQKLRRVGGRYVGLCPFHNERTPSFVIYPDSNSFYCFGCNKGGNSINYVMLLNECGFVDAVKYLING